MYIPHHLITQISREYVGIPFEEMNCFTLVRAIYARLGIEIPEHPDEAREKVKYIPARPPQAGDIVLMKTNGSDHINHLGIYLGDRKMVHSIKNVGVVITPINKRPFSQWIAGFVRVIPKGDGKK